MPSACSVLTPASLAEAVAAITERDATPFAGATWILRAPIRGEPLGGSYVAVSGLAELRAIETEGPEIAVGAAVTHASLGTALGGIADCGALVQAASGAANPAIREVATLGGNLCAASFAPSDLAPALLALDAQVEISRVSGVERHSIEAFLAARTSLPPGWLLTRVLLPRAGRVSAHARLPLRRAGDYPVAIVSVSMVRLPDGAVSSVRIAVGSVEPVARRWLALERILEGQPLDPDVAAEAARERTNDFLGRDSVESPGWYRTQVLPKLVRAAMRGVLAQG
jgi:aerobic carbon-monoxide dehydrogenase medium subunit